MPSDAILTQPLRLRNLALRNRLLISPMCMYSAVDGMAEDFHLVHLGRFALGGAGLVFVEATAVSSPGRITAGCLGLWSDAHIPGFRRITDFLHSHGSAAGIQLSHAGHKGSSQRPWEGAGPLLEADPVTGLEPWGTVSSSELPFADGWPAPAEMSAQQMEEVADQFAQAARRADSAGFDVIELHAAHGYLLHSFLSPITNLRTDAFGGSIEGRMRFPLQVVESVRAVWPDHKPLFVRISSVDGVDVGWSLDDSILFAKALKARGVDAVDCSSGGMTLTREQQLVQRTPGFHVPYAAAIRRQADIATIAVGLIRDPAHAEDILAEGSADLVSIAREALFDPNWMLKAGLELEGGRAWDSWPERYGWWLMRRARQQKDLYGPDALATDKTANQ